MTSKNPLTPLEATHEIRRILKQDGEVRMTRHVQEDVDDPRDWAHNVSDDEVLNCLQHGKVTKNADYNADYDEFTYQVEFAYDTHQLVTVTAIFSAAGAIRVITRYRRKTPYDRRKPRAPK